mmetsp:Transcript_106870/g.300463  ORF Transcript_106870/g.300463 Transcript_106870/m.300463 type:complete len:436 (-) Transcript_106870:155-1462(-)
MALYVTLAAAVLAGSRVDALEVAAPSRGDMQPGPSRNSSGVVLRQAARKAGQLPKVSDMLPTFGAVQSEVAALRARVADVQVQGVRSLTRLRDEFETKLRQQRDDTHAMALFNKRLEMRIDDLRKSSATLRQRAEQLLSVNKKLSSRIASLQADFSLAVEFSSLTLNHSFDLIERAPEVAILTELREKEAADAKEAAHKKSLSSLALLRVAPAAENRAPEDIVRSLGAILSDLSTRQTASERELQEAFAKTFVVGEHHQKIVLEEQARLNAMVAKEQDTNDKLASAVRHLQGTYQHLLDRSRSLKSFAARLSAAPVPELGVERKAAKGDGARTKRRRENTPEVGAISVVKTESSEKAKAGTTEEARTTNSDKAVGLDARAPIASHGEVPAPQASVPAPHRSAEPSLEAKPVQDALKALPRAGADAPKSWISSWLR